MDLTKLWAILDKNRPCWPIFITSRPRNLNLTSNYQTERPFGPIFHEKITIKLNISWMMVDHEIKMVK